ncbi:MAG: DUF29 domain-containing protein [Gemmatimonadaceae bacterium]|nr:DUF29 domain-containing protein [Gloeobacterales cyanobacterium ES-bin-141]
MQPAETTYPTQSLYEADFYRWGIEQAALIRARKWEELDIENLAEEIESLGKQQRQEVRSRLVVLIGHLLKWEYQPQKRSQSWFRTIRVQRKELGILMRENPSLQPYVPEAISLMYENAVDLAADETALPYVTFPQVCPYMIDQLLDDNFPGLRTE